MKNILIALMLFFVCVQSQEDCSIIAPRKILCKEKVESSTVLTLYRMGYDDRWIYKRYYPRQGDKEDAVFTGECGKIDSTRVVNLCIGAIMSKVEYSELDSAKAAEIGNLCKAYSKTVKTEIVSGVKREIPEILYYLQGDKTLISEVHCFEASYVRTYKANKLTGLKTDRKDYHGLKPGTYCQDFFATDELYWEPAR